MPCLMLAGLGELRLQRGDLRVHVGEDGGDGGLFVGVGGNGSVNLSMFVSMMPELDANCES